MLDPTWVLVAFTFGLLAAAIVQAWAGWSQAKTTVQLAELESRLVGIQEAVEASRTRVQVFARLQCASFTESAGPTLCLLIANLSHMGIWLEDVTPISNPDAGEASTKPVPVRKALPPYEQTLIPLNEQAQILAQGSYVLFMACKLTYWANGQEDGKRTEKYKVSLGGASTCTSVEPMQ